MVSARKSRCKYAWLPPFSGIWNKMNMCGGLNSFASETVKNLQFGGWPAPLVQIAARSTLVLV